MAYPVKFTNAEMMKLNKMERAMQDVRLDLLEAMKTHCHSDSDFFKRAYYELKDAFIVEYKRVTYLHYPIIK